MRFKQFFLTERTRLSPEILYHGTSSKFLDKIKKIGLIANPPHKGYGSEIKSSYSQENMESIGGVYLTTKFMTSYSAANAATRKFGGSPIIVSCEIMSKSAHADEDSIRNRLSETLSSVLTRNLGGHSWWYDKGFMDANPKIADEIINDFATKIHQSLSFGNEKHPIDLNLLKEYFISRLNIYLFHDNAESFYDYGRGLSDGGSLPGGDPSKGENYWDNYDEIKKKGIPLDSLEVTENRFKAVLDRLTRRYRDSAKNEGFLRSLRITDDIGYSGRNKIVGIVRLVSDEKGYTRKAVIEYGTITPELQKEILNCLGGDIEFVNKEFAR